MPADDESEFRRELRLTFRRRSNPHGLDPRVRAAKRDILEVFHARPSAVFYGKQLEVMFEKRPYEHFHWITTKALLDLVAEGSLAAEASSVPSTGRGPKFYWLPKNRYWRRRASSIAKLVAQFSAQPFTRALGFHGELMVTDALSGVGFQVVARDAREWNGQRWSATDHDLDRILVRDGVAYGTEIKNRLEYISREELRTKIAMCLAFGIRPLFVVRSAPRNYVNDVRLLGGFVLIVGKQLYPFGHAELARRVREDLEIPVDCPQRLEDGIPNRLLAWHTANLAVPVRHDPTVEQDFMLMWPRGRGLEDDLGGGS